MQESRSKSIFIIYDFNNGLLSSLISTYQDSIENIHVRKNIIQIYMTTTKEIRVYIVML